MYTLLGSLWLLGLVVRSGFRARGAYWSWRRETAIGRADLPFRDRVRLILDYARWLERMRRVSRQAG